MVWAKKSFMLAWVDHDARGVADLGPRTRSRSRGRSRTSCAARCRARCGSCPRSARSTCTTLPRWPSGSSTICTRSAGIPTGDRVNPVISFRSKSFENTTRPLATGPWPAAEGGTGAPASDAAPPSGAVPLGRPASPRRAGRISATPRARRRTAGAGAARSATRAAAAAARGPGGAARLTRRATRATGSSSGVPAFGPSTGQNQHAQPELYLVEMSHHARSSSGDAAGGAPANKGPGWQGRAGQPGRRPARGALRIARRGPRGDTAAWLRRSSWSGCAGWGGPSPSTSRGLAGRWSARGGPGRPSRRSRPRWTGLAVRAWPLVCDLRDRATLGALVDRPGVDLVVAAQTAGGRFGNKALIEIEAAELASGLEAYVGGTWNLLQVVGRKLLEQQRGTFLQIGTSSGVRTKEGFAALGAAQHGLRALVQVAAREWRSHRVHVAYLPIDAAIETPAAAAWVAKELGRNRAVPPQRRSPAPASTCIARIPGPGPTSSPCAPSPPSGPPPPDRPVRGPGVRRAFPEHGPQHPGQRVRQGQSASVAHRAVGPERILGRPELAAACRRSGRSNRRQEPGVHVPAGQGARDNHGRGPEPGGRELHAPGSRGGELDVESGSGRGRPARRTPRPARREGPR